MTKAFVEGKDVSLFPFRREHLPAYQSWLDNPSVTQFMEQGWRPPTEGDLENLYASMTGADSAVFAIVNNATGNVIGSCGLYAIQWICRRADFRIIMAAESQGKGLGTEAARLTISYGFDRLNLETIYLGVNTDNKAAIKSYEKAGFTKEGVRRKLIYRNGVYYDALMMSILRDEYITQAAFGASTEGKLVKLDPHKPFWKENV